MIDDYVHEIGGVQFQHFPQAPKPTGFRKNRVAGGAHFAPQLLHRDVWIRGSIISPCLNALPLTQLAFPE
jgi:hypothetical protein